MLLRYGAYKNFDGRTVVKINQRGRTWRIRKGEQSFLSATHRYDLIHIPIKLHEDIPKGYRVIARTRMFAKIIKEA